jgi:hypothetical protein
MVGDDPGCPASWPATAISGLPIEISFFLKNCSSYDGKL